VIWLEYQLELPHNNTPLFRRRKLSLLSQSPQRSPLPRQTTKARRLKQSWWMPFERHTPMGSLKVWCLLMLMGTLFRSTCSSWLAVY